MIEKIFAIDTKLTAWLTLPPTSSWGQPAKWAAHTGDGQYVFGTLGLIYLAGWLGEDASFRWRVATITVTVFIVMAIVTLIKYVVRRGRPHPPGEFVVFQYDAYSFPSGHSARLAALAVSVFLFYPIIGWLLGLAAIGVGLARIAVGVHYVSDVIIGLGLGSGVAWGISKFLPLLPISLL